VPNSGIGGLIPEWGSMISSGRSYLFNAPHIALVPGIFISLTVLGFNIVGDGLRDALDPRSKKIL
jgi:peptide/nickel transport system permease protein